MDMQSVLANIISDFEDIFRKKFLKSTNEIFSDAENIVRQNDSQIFCNIWLKETLTALQKLDFTKKLEENYFSFEQLTNHMIEYAHKICTNPMNDIQEGRIELENVHDLSYYSPREKLLALFERDILTRQSSLNKYADNCSELKSCSMENYIDFFRLLLEFEDIEGLRDYVPLVHHNAFLCENKKNPKMFSFDLKPFAAKNIESMVIPNIDEVIIIPRRSSFTPTKLNCIKQMVSFDDELYTRLARSIGSAICSYRALVTSVSKDAITFEFNELKPCHMQLMDKNPFVVIFRPARHSIRYQHCALNLLIRRKGSMLNFLYPPLIQDAPKSEPNNESFKLINDQLDENPEQLQAVRTIVSGPNTRAPFIIFGPPGTGKTTTVVEAILQLRLQKPHTRILVAAGSNAACDTIAARLCEWEKNPYYREQLAKSPTYPMLRIFAKEILRRGTANLPDDLVYRSNVKWNNGRHAYPSVKDIKQYGIVVTTLCTVGKLVNADVNDDNYFTHVFIDEAGASSEPETLMGIMGIKTAVGEGSCYVILSGDHKQLGPVIKSRTAEERGLGGSMMERLLKTDSFAVNENGEYNRLMQARLRRNYRSHPEIVKLYNHLFYGDELIAMLDEKKFENKLSWSFLPNPQYPIAFQVVRGEMSKAGSKSSSNLLEIDALMAFIKLLLKDRNVQQSDIGIITPYGLQSKLIKKRLSEEDYWEVEVGSVEKYQGREKLIILASMVRSDSNLGFVKCPRRLNVLLSRPISLLVIFGDSTTLERSEDLKYVIDQCKEKGNYLEKLSTILGLSDTTTESEIKERSLSSVRENRVEKDTWRSVNANRRSSNSNWRSTNSNRRSTNSIWRL